MKKSIYLSLFLIFIGINVFSQKLKIAVANPRVGGLYASPKIAAKLPRLEVMKLDLYTIVDEFDMADVFAKSEEYQKSCLGIDCLSRLGEELKVDYIVSGSFDGLGNKIAITLNN